VTPTRASTSYSAANRVRVLSQVQQTVACNSMHTTEERMCRWPLVMHDSAGGESLPYTHEFLSHILGANRKSVTLAAQSMQTAGLISYRRGDDSGPRPRGPGAGVVRMLRHRQGTFRRIPHGSLDCRTRTPRGTNQGK
jgi:hypothetical protein